MLCYYRCEQSDASLDCSQLETQSAQNRAMLNDDLFANVPVEYKRRFDFLKSSIPSNPSLATFASSHTSQSPAMQFHAILAALTLFTAVQAAAPLPRELVAAVRAGTLDRRLTCEVPLFGGGLCAAHCEQEHPKKGNTCTGVCKS
jgi:hypothetical protein